MLPLYLLAAHLVGDFVLQTRWQASRKIDDHAFRLRHVFAYSVPFWPIATIYGRHPWWHGGAFTFCLTVLHYLTDSRRFHSSLGDVIGCIFAPSIVKAWPPPNPWAPLPIVIDQTLHVCQLALLAGLLLT